jgi:aspartyl-tRNA(Asn)/glutamyl-tRNA(Gln) amidotransferase subunit B
VKNLNSFRFLKQAIEYEVARQVAIVEGGGVIHQETRLFDSDTGETASMRSKEDAHDYRYFPEPDLVPLRVSENWLADVRATMPELPAAKRARFIEVYGLREYDAEVLTSTRAMAEYYETVAAVSGDPRMAANWVIGEGKEIAESALPARHLGELVGMIVKGELSGKLAKEVLPKMIESGEAPAVIVQREGLAQISDSGALEKIVDEVLAANPKQVEQFKGGKTTVIGFLVGQVMKASRGQANPAAVNEMMKAKLS